jgi:chromosome segregation ATPase
MRISAQQRQHNEARIRAAMDRLLRGDIPASGGCDAKTLAQQADVDRTAFYGTRPYAHLREEFENRLQALREAGEVSDLRAAQVARLKKEIDSLKLRLSGRDQTITTLTDFKTEALSRLAAQHDEITRLRTTVTTVGNVRRLPARAQTIGPCN